jgi:hypothetical protein
MACRTCLVDSAVKAEQHFIMDRLLPILVTVVLIYFDHDNQLAQFPHDLLQDLVEV